MISLEEHMEFAYQENSIWVYAILPPFFNLPKSGTVLLWTKVSQYLFTYMI